MSIYYCQSQHLTCVLSMNGCVENVSLSGNEKQSLYHHILITTGTVNLFSWFQWSDWNR